MNRDARTEELEAIIHRTLTPLELAIRKRLKAQVRDEVIEECARVVEDHWNDQIQTVNQHDQAQRSARAIRAMKGEAEQKSHAVPESAKVEALLAAHREKEAAHKLIEAEMTAKGRAGVLWMNSQCAAWPRYMEAMPKFASALADLLSTDRSTNG